MARPKGKSGAKKKRFVMLDHALLKSPRYLGLSYKAKILLTDALVQFNGKNNGDFCLTLSVMKQRGWSSNDTLSRAIKELIDAEFLVLTRQGGRNKCNLYGVTWIEIHECGGKLDIKPTLTPLEPLSIRKD